MSRLFFAGLIGSLLSGLIAGWLRYWLGFMVIFHGLAFALLTTWIFNRLRPAPAPGYLWTNAAAWSSAPVFLAAFWGAQIAGLGLAQPVFDPLQFFLQIAGGSEGESFMAMTRHRTYSGGLTGLFWIFTNLLDSGLMLVFFATMMRDDEETETSTAKADSDVVENDEDDEDAEEAEEDADVSTASDQNVSGNRGSTGSGNRQASESDTAVSVSKSCDAVDENTQNSGTKQAKEPRP